MRITEETPLSERDILNQLAEVFKLRGRPDEEIVIAAKSAIQTITNYADKNRRLRKQVDNYDLAESYRADEASRESDARRHTW